MPNLTHHQAELHYELDGPADGLPVLYISGFSAHSNDILGTALRRGFSAAGCRVLALDNRGSGQTRTPDGAQAIIADMADDIAAVMDAEGINAVHLLGISMGGAIGLTLALRHPHKVRSQVIAVSLAHAQHGRAEFMLRTTRALREAGVPRELINRTNAVYLLSEDAFKIEPLMQAWINAPLDPLMQTPQGFELQIDALDGFDIRAELPGIRTPTLVISSPDDLLVPPRFQREIAAAIPGAQFREYPGGHVFMVLPMYTPQFIADVLAFWQAH